MEFIFQHRQGMRLIEEVTCSDKEWCIHLIIAYRSANTLNTVTPMLDWTEAQIELSVILVWDRWDVYMYLYPQSTRGNSWLPASSNLADYLKVEKR